MQEATKNAFTGFTDKDTGKVIQPIKQDSAMGFAIE
jgi:hypothetical protein